MKELVLVVLCACATSAPPPAEPSTPPAPQGQSLADAVTLLCAAPSRTEADPAFAAAEPAMKAVLLSRHLTEGIHNPEVLAVRDGWSSADKTGVQKVADLDQLTTKAGFTGKCELRDVWAPR